MWGRILGVLERGYELAVEREVRSGFPDIIRKANGGWRYDRCACQLKLVADLAGILTANSLPCCALVYLPNLRFDRGLRASHMLTYGMARPRHTTASRTPHNFSTLP